MTEKEYFREMKEAGIVGAVAHTAENGNYYKNLRAKNVIHCAGSEAKVDVPRIERGLKSGQYSCIKIYLGYVHQYAYDKNYEPAYQLAEKYHVPVVFHTGDTDSKRAKLKYADPLTVDEVAVDHPNVNFIICHLGSPWFGDCMEVVYKNKNVYTDISGLVLGNFTEIGRAHV